MTYHETELKAEIHALIDDLETRREILRPQWIAQQSCEAHRAGLVANSDEAAFWEYTGYTIVRKLATECINERVNDSNSRAVDRQLDLDLPGFRRKHLQNYYVVRRNGEDIGISVIDLTDEEIDAKAALFRSQARQTVAHAEELERFKEWRNSLTASAWDQVVERSPELPSRKPKA